MMEFARTKHRMAAISLIPLIDVSIFLLIFFMLVGSVEKIDIVPISPPIAQSGHVVGEGHITIIVGKHDEIILADEFLAPGDVEKAFAAALNGNPNKIITVKADAEAEANRVIAVMDAIRRAGGRNLSLVTQSEPKREAGNAR